VGLATGKQAFPDVSIPWSDPGGINRDQDLMAVEAWNRECMSSENVRAAEAIDRGRKHRARHSHDMTA
jgi:hypothetical protein